MKIIIILMLLKLSRILTLGYTSDYSYEITFSVLFEDSTYDDGNIFCPQKNGKYIHYRGKPEKIETVINNKKYNSYSAVYITNNIESSIIKNFPTSTIFFVNDAESMKEMIDKYKDYCFIELYAVNRFEFYRHYYVNLYLKMDDDLKDYIIYFIVLFTLIFFISIFVYFCFYSSKHLIKIYVNYFARRNIHISYFLSYSCLFFYFFMVFL